MNEALTVRRRTLADAGLDGPPVMTFKSDGRSAVWRVDTARGPIVVKRFTYAPLRQWCGLRIGAHPAQREIRGNSLLRRAGVSVIEIVDAGAERAGAGCRAWLATPGAGTSLYRILARTEPGLPEPEPAVDAAARITIDLLRASLFFKDLKPSNIVIAPDGAAAFIDACSVRPARGGDDIEHMLAVMERSMRRHGIDEALRERFFDNLRGEIGSRTAP